jgi:hypothetical protein
MSEKGFRNSLWELLRPFGEDVPGKVTIRDSNGLSKVAEGFSIRFSRFGDSIEHPDPTVSGFRNPTSSQAQNGTQAGTSRDKQFLTDVEAVVDSHLSYAEESFAAMPHRGLFVDQETDSGETSPYYALYLRRLLSGLPISPHETFSHPIACVIAISSRNPDPLEELRRLYTETNQGAKKLPPWVDSEFLRYYVLVHDEEKDDITKSMGLFEQTMTAYHYPVVIGCQPMRNSRTSDEAKMMRILRTQHATYLNLMLLPFVHLCVRW